MLADEMHVLGYERVEAQIAELWRKGNIRRPLFNSTLACSTAFALFFFQCLPGF